MPKPYKTVPYVKLPGLIFPWKLGGKPPAVHRVVFVGTPDVWIPTADDSWLASGNGWHFANLKMAIEIVDLPIKNCFFSIVMQTFTGGSSPLSLLYSLVKRCFYMAMFVKNRAVPKLYPMSSLVNGPGKTSPGKFGGMTPRYDIMICH